jgi:glutaminyl-peptide cyclotransferase
MIRANLKWILIVLLLLFLGTALLPVISKFFDGGNTPSVSRPSEIDKPLPALDIPQFNTDSAYSFTEKIVSFGPRVTGTPTAARVRNWITDQFKKYGADIMEQNFKDKTYDGKPLDCTNIIARFNLNAPTRILLSAHWDSRNVADQDSVRTNEPILGADDSGSAVGTLIEIARQLQAKPLSNMGVDIVLFDAEDLGEKQSENGWCIGSKYWATHLHTPGYRAKYGILMDMIGSKDARFTRELLSVQYAPFVVEKVWRVGRHLGYKNLFVEEQSNGPLTDDHVYVNSMANIPMIDIINHPANSFFGKYWHTHNDNMTIIDKNTLKAVGQTVLSVLHYEQADVFQ